MENKTENKTENKKFHCEECKLRLYSERKPNSLIARIWKWHIKWCPGWKKYQKYLEESNNK